MEYSLILMNQIFIMFLLIGVGILLYRCGLVDAAGNTQLTNLLLYVIMPCLILNTYQMEYDPVEAKNLLFGFFISLISIVAAIFISLFARIKAKKEILPTEQFSIIFTNCGFMAIPLMDALFGQLGVFYCNAYLTVFNFVVWTYGVILMKPRDGRKTGLAAKLKLFLTPTMVSIFAGLLLYFCQIRFSYPVGKAIGFLASMNTPLAMLVSGIYIAQSNLFAALRKPRIYYIAFLKCLAVPAVVLVLFLFLPIDETLRLTILIAAACPAASNGMLFANQFGRDVNNASHLFAVTTIFSILSLPLVILAAQTIFS